MAWFTGSRKVGVARFCPCLSEDEKRCLIIEKTYTANKNPEEKDKIPVGDIPNVSSQPPIKITKHKEMTTKSRLPPAAPPPPPSSGNPPCRASSPPRPQYAAVPFICDAGLPVQETGDQGGNSHNFQNTSPPPQHTDNSTLPPPPPHGKKDIETDEGKKQHPVQETGAPPQAYENPQPSETEGSVSTLDEDGDIQHSRSA